MARGELSAYEHKSAHWCAGIDAKNGLAGVAARVRPEREACIFLLGFLRKRYKLYRKRYKWSKGGQRKNAWRMWGNAKRNDGIISLTRNNDGLSRWRDKSAQSLFYLLSHSVRKMDRKYKKITLHYLHYCTLEGKVQKVQKVQGKKMTVQIFI